MIAGASLVKLKGLLNISHKYRDPYLLLCGSSIWTPQCDLFARCYGEIPAHMAHRVLPPSEPGFFCPSISASGRVHPAHRFFFLETGVFSDWNCLVRNSPFIAVADFGLGCLSTQFDIEETSQSSLVSLAGVSAPGGLAAFSCSRALSWTRSASSNWSSSQSNSSRSSCSSCVFSCVIL